MAYVSTADINAYLGISGEDTFVAVINASAEAIFNNLIGSTGLASASVTEKINYPAYTDNHGFSEGQIFYLSKKNPTAIATIDGVAVTINTDFVLEGQKVFLKNPLSYQSVFPYKNTIVYTAGYVTIPDDVKQAIYMIVGGLYNSRKTDGLSSFSQDLLTVNYSNKGTLDTLLDKTSKGVLSSIISKYSVPFTLTTGTDRTIY